jgi:hypothetical protein
LTGRARTSSRRLVGDSAAINYIRLLSLPPWNEHLAGENPPLTDTTTLYDDILVMLMIDDLVIVF